MKSKKYIAAGIATLLAAGGWSGSHASSVSEKQENAKAAKPDEADHGQPDSTEISAEAAAKAGIVVEPAGSGLVHEAIVLTGRITLNQNTTGQVKARFPGIVREVKLGQGEAVKAGQVMATVESNESLQVYDVKSPMSGVILAKNTNVGDVAGDEPLFTVGDISNVWAEFHVFPRDVDRIKPGQNVTVTSFEGHHTSESTIGLVLPMAEASSQTIVARVILQNESGLWHSGMTVRGDVAVNAKNVPIAVRTAAIQRMEGKPSVFVKEGDRFTMRPVKLGLGDDQWTEIRDGLQLGELYVSANSFMIKADIGKAGADHEE